MSFKDMNIKGTYRTNEDDVVHDFLVPILKDAITYKRAAGFFSSTALIHLSHGISGLINNGGKMKLVVSPNLSKEDIEAIKEGYLKKEKIIENAMLRSLNTEISITEKDRLNLMISLIENGILEIKVAVLECGKQMGMYHEKIGILIDKVENKIAFTGSYNESLNSYVNNFESLDVYTSFSNEFNRVIDKERDFDQLWNNRTDKLIVKEFPEAVKEELIKVYYDKDNLLSEEEIIEKERKQKEIFPQMPDDFLRDYQRDAIEKWKQDGYVGIFDMATGTGKTLTALGASIQLLKDTEYNLAICIVCPYTHLVEQWAEDLKFFGFCPIIGYGTMRNKKWKENLKNKILKFKLGLTKYLCFITTNATFSSTFIQNELKKIENRNVLFIADEAHNLGAPNIKKSLNPNIKYKLALSATFERYNDEEGTKKLLDYFGSNYSIHYSLHEAIKNEMLTEYKYYPIIVYLEEDELDEYITLTRKLALCIKKDKDGKTQMNEKGKMILLQRARLIAGARGKANKLIELLKEQKERNAGEINNTLIYCGATTVNDIEYKDQEVNQEEEKQIDYIRKQIKNKIGISVAKFTSTENQEERKLIKRQFISKEINAIVAIKCLDEGVNIPSIHTAYLLASSTNPREYVQRRGRVLRTARDKEYAEIYDFITLPRKLQNNIPKEILKQDIGLIKRELIRLDDFAADALNLSESIKIKDKIYEVYGTLLNENKEGVIE